MLLDDELDACRVYAMAFQLKELTIRFHRDVDRLLAFMNAPLLAITEQDRAAIEDEVVFDALRRAADETFGAASRIIPNAVDEAVRLILIHVAETSQSHRATLDLWACNAAGHSAKGH